MRACIMVGFRTLPTPREPTDNELFDEVMRLRSGGEDFRAPLGELALRWRRSAGVVVRRIQASYRVEAPDDEDDFFQEGVGRLIDKGLDQYRGVSEQVPGKTASPKTFFLRIVKHLAIDRYRQRREVLQRGAPTQADEPTEHVMHEVREAMRAHANEGRRAEARESYWAAFERLRREHPLEAAAWDVYHHQDVEDHNECARILQITVVNSYKRVSRAQAHLKRYLLECESEQGARDE